MKLVEEIRREHACIHQLGKIGVATTLIDQIKPARSCVLSSWLASAIYGHMALLPADRAAMHCAVGNCQGHDSLLETALDRSICTRVPAAGGAKARNNRETIHACIALAAGRSLRCPFFLVRLQCYSWGRAIRARARAL